MRTAGPAAWPAPAYATASAGKHAFAHFIKPDRDAAPSRLSLLRGGNPADPFVACERRNIRPHVFDDRIRGNCLAKIHRQCMGCLGSSCFCGHSSVAQILKTRHSQSRSTTSSRSSGYFSIFSTGLPRVSNLSLSKWQIIRTGTSPRPSYVWSAEAEW